MIKAKMKDGNVQVKLEGSLRDNTSEAFAVVENVMTELTKVTGRTVLEEFADFAETFIEVNEQKKDTSIEEDLKDMKALLDIAKKTMGEDDPMYKLMLEKYKIAVALVK